MEEIKSNENKSAHSDLYKSRGNSKLSQNERRLQLLEDQKVKRHLITDKNRELSELFKTTTISDDTIEDVECELVEKKSMHSNNLHLMKTEWFIDIPEDLEENWFVKFGPRGFRVLLIARNNKTKVVNKNNKYLRSIQTNFPGGGGCNRNGLTVLECIYNHKLLTFFVLDCIFWNDMSLLDMEASFRFYWLQSKFLEEKEIHHCRKYKFVLMEHFPSERSLIQERFFEVANLEGQDVLYNGVVFYHKESLYSFNSNPLVTWLATYMLPEKLNIDIPEVYHQMIPKDYQNLDHFLSNITLFYKKGRKHKKEPEIENMEDTVIDTDSENMEVKLATEESEELED